MILTRDKLLMCHEDVETSFVRTLGSANLVDITAVLNDELCYTYIVLVSCCFVRPLGSANLVDITAVLNDELCNTYIVLVSCCFV